MMWFRQVICEGLFQNVYSQFLVMFATCHIESVLGSLIFQGADAPCHNTVQLFLQQEQYATTTPLRTTDITHHRAGILWLKMSLWKLWQSRSSSLSFRVVPHWPDYCSYWFFAITCSTKVYNAHCIRLFSILKNHSSSLCKFTVQRTVILKLSNFTFYWSIHFLSSLQVCLPQQ